jgi:hypothetical protein
VLDDLMLSDDKAKIRKFPGWEQALARFRHKFMSRSLTREDNVFGLTRLAQFWRALRFDTAHKYWTFHYYAFAISSGICVLMASTDAKEFPIIFLSIVAIVIATLLHTAELLRRLIFGRNSYPAHEAAWRKLLFD